MHQRGSRNPANLSDAAATKNKPGTISDAGLVQFF